jgi:hypothetical protein
VAAVVSWALAREIWGRGVAAGAAAVAPAALHRARVQQPLNAERLVPALRGSRNRSWHSAHAAGALDGRRTD